MVLSLLFCLAPGAGALRLFALRQLSGHSLRRFLFLFPPIVYLLSAISFSSLTLRFLLSIFHTCPLLASFYTLTYFEWGDCCFDLQFRCFS